MTPLRKDGYADLIARLEKATGWDAQLDHDIALATGWTMTKGAPTGLGARLQDPDGNYHYSARLFTGSIDAALTLARNQSDVMVMLHTAFITVEADPENETPNLWPCIKAMLLYILRARAALAKAGAG